MIYHPGTKSTKFVYLLICMAFTMFSASSLFAADKNLFKIVKLVNKKDCVEKGKTLIIVLDKKITRGINQVAIIGGKKTHHHPKVKEWGLRSSAIHVEIPKGKVFREGQKLGVVIERRAPHKIVSNRKNFKICYGYY